MWPATIVAVGAPRNSRPSNGEFLDLLADSAARKVIEAAGLGDRFFHRTGHGLGLEAHEDPSLDPGSKTVLEVGMVFTVEPGIYIPGWGGVRIEDDVVVEAGGCRLLTNADRSLRKVPS